MAEPTARPIVTPASRLDGDSRPLEIRPPNDLATNYREAIVRIVADVTVAADVTCTGTLIAEDLVITAHHCVTKRDDKGRPLPEDARPKDISVELGTSALPWGEVGVRAIVSPDCGYISGDGDIAVLVLTRKLVGVATIPPREQPPRLGDRTDVFGFGRCSHTTETIQLNERGGFSVTSRTADSFYAEAPICPGDSGGPAFVRHDQKDGSHELELAGVVSASVMSRDPNIAGQTVFTRIDRWPQLLSAARGIADGETSSELPPYRSCEPLLRASSPAKQPSRRRPTDE